MSYIAAIVMGYLLGCSNLAHFIAKAKKVDLYAGGSGNPGTSNAAILIGWRAAVAVAIHDIGKAFLAVVLARLLFLQLPGITHAAGVACVIGHIFPFYLKFKGGKGFASYLGMTLALNWRFALLVLVAVVVLTLITDYLVIGTFTTVLAVPAYTAFVEKGWLAAAILLVGTAVVLFRHRENVVRLYHGTEIGLRSTVKGKHRVK